MFRKLFAVLTWFNLVFSVGAAEYRPVHIADTKKECYGTHNKLGWSGDYAYHFNRIRRTYGNCTYVHGNLEITNLLDPDVNYDLDFLSKIEVVTGYVLIALTQNVPVIPLTSLKLIKGERTVKLRDERYGLAVVMVDSNELQLPALREITNGGVMLFDNPNMCHLNTIAWAEMTSDDAIFTRIRMASNSCECSESCTDETTGRRHCWGHGDNMCQKANGIRRQRCDATCPGSRCHTDGILGRMECCHSQCAIGCFGGLDTQCSMCRMYKYGHQCVSECPERTYSYAGYCVPF